MGWWPPAAPEQTNKYVCRQNLGDLQLIKQRRAKPNDGGLRQPQNKQINMSVDKNLGDLQLIKQRRAKPNDGGLQQPQNKQTNMSADKNLGDLQLIKTKKGQTQ